MSSCCAPMPISTRSRPCYKQLSSVERTFRTAKHLFSTRPIFHKLDETIRGHVFCNFLALALKAALGSHRCARPSRLLAGDHRRSGFADRDRDRGQTLPRPRRPASRRQPRLEGGRRCAAAHRPRRRGSRPSAKIRKCSAKPPARRGLLLALEDGPKSRPARKW